MWFFIVSNNFVFKVQDEIQPTTCAISNLPFPTYHFQPTTLSILKQHYKAVVSWVRPYTDKNASLEHPTMHQRGRIPI